MDRPADPWGQLETVRGSHCQARKSRMPRQQTGPAVAGCPSASCSSVGFGCHPLQELRDTAKEFGLRLASARPFRVLLDVHMCLACT